MQPVEPKELGQITLEVVNAINSLEKKKNRLIEIAVDGKVSPDEETDFAEIRAELDAISRAVLTLQLWLDQEELERRAQQ